MDILCFPTGPYATNMYLIIDKSTNEVVIIDPGVGALKILHEVIKEQKLKPIAIWLTHSHWDHIVDAATMKEALLIPIYLHIEDKGNLEEPGSDKVPMAVPLFAGTTVDHIISDNDHLYVGNLSFQVIHTPGHSPGGVCFYNEKEQTLISGDTLFKGSIGTLRLSTSQADRMWKSLDKLAILPPVTIVYPGHGPSTTIQNESWLPNAKQMWGNS